MIDKMSIPLELKITVIRPPTVTKVRREMTFTVPLLDTAHVGDILKIEQLLNRITAVRWHISIDPTEFDAATDKEK